MSGPDLILTSPLKGWSASLEEVPDPVFAERMMGDGVAVDPLGSTLHAPCDGTVFHLHAAHHAITLRSAEGAEILMHIGLETVAMDGEGFRPLVEEGQQVQRGDPLIAFDLDLVADKARSLITPVILTNAERFAIVRRTVDCALGMGEALMTIRPLDVATRDWRAEGGEAVRRGVPIILTHGVHARPAARISDCARAFEAEISLVLDERQASARSAVAMLALGIRLGDRIDIRASGRDADAAVDAIAALLATGMGEAHEGPLPAPAPRAAPPAPPPPAPATPVPADNGEIPGVIASPGLAIGRVARLRGEDLPVPHDGTGEDAEREALARARAAVRDRIAALLDRETGSHRGILEAHLAFLDDPALAERAQDEIAAGRSAAHAWRMALGEQAELLRQSGDARLAERAADLLDMERQVIRELLGLGEERLDFPPDSILVADDLLPSQLVALDLGNVKGFCLVHGGPTSHVSIIASGMGLPALVAMGGSLHGLADGQPVILDADKGRLHIDPDPALLDDMRSALDARARRRAAALAAAHAECRMQDNIRIEMFANLGSLEDARAAVANGAEGSGLLRTEFLFLDRDRAPGEDEQAAQYQAIADALEGRPLIVRLLDIGGDKPAPYLPFPAEENPALGLRGIRVGLDRPDLLETQIRAILRVRPVGQCRIMVPMLSSLAELRAVRAAVDRARTDLDIEAAVEVGIMVETPAAAATADLLAAEADFLSIGTNDLTQYVLAMDRGNPAVASGIDALHPAVLRMIAQTCAGASRHGRWTGVCGGLASDPMGIPILIGLGVTELSVTPASVPEAKALVRRLTLPPCHALAREALNRASAAEVRGLARAFLQEIDQ